MNKKIMYTTQDIISGKLIKAMNDSLNLDSALVTISDMTIRMNIITPVKKKGKGQYTLSLHMWPLAVFQ